MRSNYAVKYQLKTIIDTIKMHQEYSFTDLKSDIQVIISNFEARDDLCSNSMVQPVSFKNEIPAYEFTQITRNKYQLELDDYSPARTNKSTVTINRQSSASARPSKLSFDKLKESVAGFKGDRQSITKDLPARPYGAERTHLVPERILSRTTNSPSYGKSSESGIGRPKMTESAAPGIARMSSTTKKPRASRISEEDKNKAAQIGRLTKR